MILLNPRHLDRHYPDERSAEVMRRTVEFFEAKGLARVKEDDRAAVWYRDFLEFAQRERLFATMCTPAGYGAPDCRWDTWRICEFAEILGFYGLPYWYTWQVSVLGLGPIWMSGNEAVKRETGRLLEKGGIFAYGLSEKAHGADLYSSEMTLTPAGDGTWRANGRKYYIGNGNEASLLSTFGKMADTGEWCFFATDPARPGYTCVQNVVHSQNFVAEYDLTDYVVREEDLLLRGDAAWDAALNTVNIGKFNLGWASIGICTHAFYEAIHHAANRRLYGMAVTDFSHVKAALHRRLLPPGRHETGGPAHRRLHALRHGRRPPLPALQPGGEDEGHHPGRGRHQPHVGRHRRQGVREGHLLRDGGARHQSPAQARGDGARQHRPDRQVHGELLLPPGGPAAGAAARRPGQRRLPVQPGAGARPGEDSLPRLPPDLRSLGPAQRALVPGADPGAGGHAARGHPTPTKEQAADVDFLLALGEIFTLVVYAQLFLENAAIYEVDRDLVDQVFDVLVRDFSRFAVILQGKPTTTPAQAEHCLQMLRRPVPDPARYGRVWEQQVFALRDAYTMNP